MTHLTASQTIARIENAMDSDQSASISEIVQLIQELAGRAFSISIEELSQLIGRDPTITQKVISAANTLGFNPCGATISTISDAIHTVGFEKIRNLAISLMLAENASRRANAYEQREMAAFSVCCGMLAAELVSENYKSIAPEHIFVCASLRNYGKLLLSTFFVEEYRHARRLALTENADEAFEKVFGLTPLALSRAILIKTNIPKSIMTTLKEASPEISSSGVNSDEVDSLLAVSFSSKVCDIAFDERVLSENFEGALSGVISKFKGSFPMSLEGVTEALANVEISMSYLNHAIGINDKASPATKILNARVNGRNVPQPPAESRIAPIAKKKVFSEMDAEEREAFAEASFQEALLSIDQDVDLGKAFQSVAETIREGLDLENCMVFVREEFNRNLLSTRFGMGPLYDKIKNRPLLAPGNKDVFSICLARKEDILIQDTNAGKIKTVVPEWLDAIEKTSSLIVLPVKDRDDLFAILVGTVASKRVIALRDGDLRRIREIKARLSVLKRIKEGSEVASNSKQ